MGESGSGKSMTAHAVMGLLPKAVRPAGGAVRLAGRELLGLDEDAMRDVRGREIGMIFQEPMTSLNPVMRVSDQIRETFEAHGMLDANARSAPHDRAPRRSRPARSRAASHAPIRTSFPAASASAS